MHALNRIVGFAAALPFLLASALFCLVGNLSNLAFRALTNACLALGCYLCGIPVPKGSKSVKGAFSQHG